MQEGYWNHEILLVKGFGSDRHRKRCFIGALGVFYKTFCKIYKKHHGIVRNIRYI